MWSCVVTVLGLNAVHLQAHDSTLVEFALEDQFKHEYTHADYLESCCILVGSDRGGSTFNGQWGRAIADSLRNLSLLSQVKFIPNADLRGVPFFLKGFVRGKFSKDESQPVLLDWSGLFARSYEFNPDSSNIVVFGQDGKVVHQTAGREVEPAKVHGIVETLRRLLAPETNQE